MSSATPIGTFGATLRRRRSSSPSPSSYPSLTIAPCRSSRIASHPAAAASTILPAMDSYAAASTRPLGAALPATGSTISAPARPARSRNAPIAVPVPWNASRISAPSYGRLPLAENRASGVGTGENVLVSCFIWAMTIRMPNDSIRPPPDLRPRFARIRRYLVRHGPLDRNQGRGDGRTRTRSADPRGDDPRPDRRATGAAQRSRRGDRPRLGPAPDARGAVPVGAVRAHVGRDDAG